MQEQPLVRLALASAKIDSDHAAKDKAVEMLCRDTMKRLRNKQTPRASHTSIRNRQTEGLVGEIHCSQLEISDEECH